MSPEEKNTETPAQAKTTRSNAATTKKTERKASAAGAAEFTFSGDLTLRSVADVKTKFEELCSGMRDVTISFNNVDDVDLSFIQLLYASERLLLEDGHQLTVAGELPEACAKLIEESGLDIRFGNLCE